MRVVFKSCECDFCGRAGELRECSWPVEKPVKISAERLKLTDVIVTRGGKHLRPLSLQRVTGWGDHGGFQIWVTRIVYALHYGRDQYWMFYKLRHEKVTVLRKQPCGAVCCEEHRMDRGPKISCCQNHWRSWQEVA